MDFHFFILLATIVAPHTTLHYITCNLADAFIQSDFQLRAFNLEGTNSGQQEVSASTLASNKPNYKEPYESAAIKTPLVFNAF